MMEAVDNGGRVLWRERAFAFVLVFGRRRRLRAGSDFFGGRCRRAALAAMMFGVTTAEFNGHVMGVWLRWRCRER